MSPLSLRDFLTKHSITIGDRVRVDWKGIRVEGIILPQPLDERYVLTLKMNSGYNTGFELVNISGIEKIPHVNGVHAQAHEVPIPVTQNTSSKPGFSMVGVGGTIASKVNYETGGVSAKITPEELTQMVPQIGEFAHVKQIITPFTKMSEDMLPSDWIHIAQTVFEELQKPDVEGVVLTHGTDTLHYTAAALSFMLRDLTKPVVLVGSQRSSDRGSSDAMMNLICGARVAVGGMAEVGICMHGTTSDDYCLFIRGTSARKMHTSRRDAFRPMNQLPLAKVWPDGRIEAIGNATPRNDGRPSLDAVFDENVALIKVYPGIPADILDFYAKRGCKGFVIEGTGLGHVHTQTFVPAIQKITAQGIPVFITPQTLYGRVNLDVYTNLRLLKQAGAVGLEDMLPEVAYVKLGWVLAHTPDIQKITEMMLTNYAGEITPVSRADTFLQ